MGDVGGRPGRSSDIYPINRSESSNRGSGDRSDTYTCIHTYAPFRVPPRGRPRGYQKAPLRIYLMPNVDLLCLITGADIDGSVCASKRSAVPRRGVGEGAAEGPDWFRLLVRKVTPFSVRVRAEEKRRRRSGTVERNGQQYCRRGPGDLRGADRKGLVGAARVTREINYTLLEVLTSDRTPEADCAVRALLLLHHRHHPLAPLPPPCARFRRDAPRHSLIFR